MNSIATLRSDAAASAVLPQHELLIHGERVPAVSGRYFETLNPATEQPIARVAEASTADIDAAVRSSRNAFEGEWSKLRAAERGALMLKLAELIRRSADELVALESLDSGKPVSAISRQDLPAVIDTLTYYAGWADKIHGQVVPARNDALTYTVREPIGVVGAIIPWNFPLMIGMWKIAPALACGCTVVLKPAELTPLTALRIGELALEAGFPAGVLNVVPGFGKDAGAALVAHPDVDKITFTGSPGVGRTILQGSAGNFKRVTLELGGKSANVIFADGDLDSAVKAAASGIFFNTGQVCSAAHASSPTRMSTTKSWNDWWGRAKSVRLGDPRENSTSMGPLISQTQMERVLRYIDIGKTEGARLAAGGARVGELGYFVAPTVFADVRAGHAHRAGGNFRAGRRRDSLCGRGRCRAHRQRHAVRPCRWCLERRCRPRASHGAQAEGRHRMGQHLRPYRRATAMGRRA